ncbi:hypothetical protein CRYUN_Cryun01aG0172800 [Craigia yunnanensis]
MLLAQLTTMLDIPNENCCRDILFLELSKVVAKQAEEGKEKKLSEDNVKDLSSDLQKLTDEYMKKIDSIYKQKEKELLTV